MKEILILSSKNYDNSETTNYGDCILINTGSELIIYDCGLVLCQDLVQVKMRFSSS